jgi:hypothetical protein
MQGMINKGLFNNILIISDYVTSNAHMINEFWVGKDVEGSDHGLFSWSSAFAFWD